MNNANIEIERVVREVLARLERETAATVPSTPSSGRALRIDGHVISRAELDGRLDGVRAIAIRRDSIITPAARDLLREANVAVEKTAVAGRGEQQTTSVLLGVAETDFDPSGLVMDLEKRHITVRRAGGGGLIAVIDELTEAVVRAGTRAVLCSAQPQVALCLANRTCGVRACSASDVSSLRRGLEALGANMLVLDPTELGPSSLGQCVQQFVAFGPRPCPDRYRERLE